jgi:CrcB protein
VNLVGSFLLALVIPAAARIELSGIDARLVLGVGLLGGFTTYSSFNLETLRMIEQGLLLKALGYSAITLVGCLLAGALGLSLGKAWAAAG